MCSIWRTIFIDHVLGITVVGGLSVSQVITLFLTPVIYLYMDGGMSHVDTLDPKSGDVMGPTKTIQTSADGLQLGEYLPRTAKQMHHATVFRSLTSTQGAHEQGNYFMHTSFGLRSTIKHPGMGAWLSFYQGAGNPALPPYVYVGNDSRHPGAGFFAKKHGPLMVNNPEAGLQNVRPPKGVTDDRFAMRRDMAFYSRADITVGEGETARERIADHARARVSKATGRDFSNQSTSESIDLIQYFLFPNLGPWAGMATPPSAASSGRLAKIGRAHV